MNDWSSKELELIRKNEAIDMKMSSQKVTTEEIPAEPVFSQDKITHNDEEDELLQQQHNWVNDDFYTLEPRMTRIPVKIAQKIQISKNQSAAKNHSFQLIMKELDKQKSANVDLQQELDLTKNELKHLKVKLRLETTRQSSDIEAQERQKEMDLQNLQREITELKEELKRRDSKAKTELVRLNRQAEDIVKLRSERKNIKEQHKEQLGKLERQRADLESQVKSKEKQLKQLTEAFRKQMELVHVLKQQKLHLEACQVLNFTKEEFLNSDKWQPFKEKENSK